MQSWMLWSKHNCSLQDTVASSKGISAPYWETPMPTEKTWNCPQQPGIQQVLLTAGEHSTPMECARCCCSHPLCWAA